MEKEFKLSKKEVSKIASETLKEAGLYPKPKEKKEFKLDEKELARIKIDNQTETYDDMLICPWCNYEFEDCWELDDGGGEVDCESCGKTFIY